MGRGGNKGRCFRCQQYGHHQRDCPVSLNTAEGRLQARLDTFERPYPGYEYELGRGGQEAYGGHEFMVICRSNGTAWPPLVPQGMYGCWFSDKEHEVARGAIQLRDPNEKRGSVYICLLYTSPSPRDKRQSRMPSSA